MDAPATLLVGTTKGAFLLEPRPRDWEVRGPFCDGWPINHMAADPETGAIWAAGGGEWEGAGVWRSSDGGASWTLSRLARGKLDDWLAAEPAMADQFGREAAPSAPFDGRLHSMWSLARADGALYAGSKPAALFRSRDGGESWAELEGLTRHPSSDDWEPGGAGLTLHSIVVAPEAPERIWVGISAAGVFASEDGGATWDRRNRLANSASGGEEVGHCVHNLVRAAGPADEDRLYQQNHHGVFRSHDGGRSWQAIHAGLPSTFGFPVAAHPRDPETLWVLPLNGDTLGRFPPDASAAVWRSRDGGGSWQALRSGLPERNCFFTVLRQAMANDRADPAGVYFGTNTGSVFASRDEGETWQEAARHLPAILCVETLEKR